MREDQTQKNLFVRYGGKKTVKITRCIGLLSLFVLSFVLCPLCAVGDEDIPRVSITDLKKLVDSGSDVIILDTQPKAVYDKGHIKGAISFPWRKKITLLDIEGLPRDRLIVMYCDCGPGESDSADVASRFLQMGFGEVKVLKDPSIQGWKKAGYPVE
jgi:rhodanese-related sulfurtransferase